MGLGGLLSLSPHKDIAYHDGHLFLSLWQITWQWLKRGRIDCESQSCGAGHQDETLTTLATFLQWLFKKVCSSVYTVYKNRFIMLSYTEYTLIVYNRFIMPSSTDACFYSTLSLTTPPHLPIPTLTNLFPLPNPSLLLSWLIFSGHGGDLPSLTREIDKSLGHLAMATLQKKMSPGPLRPLILQPF